MAQAPPEEKMTLIRVAPIVTVAIARDVLVFIFSTFIFLAPFFAATAVNIYLEGNGWPSWAAGLASLVVGASTAAAEIFLAPITSALLFFGSMMAFITSLLGWIIVNTLLLVYRVNPFSAGLLARNVAGLGILTLSVLLIISHQRKKDKEARKKWEAENAAREAKERQQQAQAAQIIQMQQAQQAAEIEEEAAFEEVAESEAANDNMAQMDAANDNEEIPERARLVA